VCKVIPGKLPKAAQPEIIGLAAGELVTALEKVDIGDLKSPTPPYYEIYDVHHAINKEKFLAEVSQTLNPKPPVLYPTRKALRSQASETLNPKQVKKPVFDDCRAGMEKLLVEFEVSISHLLRVWGFGLLGFLWFRVYGFGFFGFGFWVLGLGFMGLAFFCLGFRVYGFRV
jgi:hypothetical protein